MVLPEDGERRLYKQFHDLCRSLNLDKGSSSEAWKSFCEIYEPYMLAGDAMHWMGCALYVACKSATIPTVSKTSVIVQGNLVNLKGLLKLIDLSIVEFFIKIRRWANFARLSNDFLRSLDQLERDFTVSMVLFKKFQPIFADMFSDKVPDCYKGVVKNKKIKLNQVALVRIFDFSWTLFICVKSNYPRISDDLVNSYHLLLACFDYIFVNIYVSGRKDIINGTFPIPQTMKSKCNSLSDVPCILDVLCSRHEGIPVEAKSIKEYCWRKHIKQMFEKRLLKGNTSLLCDVTDPANFEQNFKAVNKNYEEYVLSVGTFDERIFLGRTNNVVYVNKLGEISEQLEAKRKMLNRTTPMTPLTGRQYLNKPERTINYSTFNSESQNFASLQSIVGLREAAPSEYLSSIINLCDPKPALEEIVQKLALLVKERYIEDNDVSREHADKRCEVVIKLFYKVMDSIVREENKKPVFDAKVLFNQEIFIKTLFACAFEIMACLCTSPHRYPWISKVLDLPHYYFYKIIEVVVRNEDSLSRDVVKHLNTIEEKILDSLAWQKESPLWRAIIDSGLSVPCSDDVNRSSSVESTPTKQVSDVDKLSAIAGKESSLTNSPGAPLADKFTVSHRICVKRSNEGEPGEGGLKLVRLENSSDVSKANPVSLLKSQGSTIQDQMNELCNGKDGMNGLIKKPKRTGHVALFFRKFYILAAVRMLDLCKQLNLNDVEVRKKIWTCFEETIVKHVGLMLDRHLDQMLMCSIYLISKVVGISLQFTDVMKCYRNQPQATSDVYREVLMSPDLTLDDIKDLRNLEETDRQEQRNDIIKFYNAVFVSKHRSLVKKLNATGENDRMVLSPIPVGLTSPPNTSRRISEKHSLYLRSLDCEKTGENSPINNSQLSYKFSRSPAKDLKAINNMVSKAEISRVGKRLLTDDDSAEKLNSYSMVLTRKVKGLYNDRISAGAQE